MKSFTADDRRRFNKFVPTDEVDYAKLTVANSFYIQ
jgi:hypothetical protein